MTFIQNINIKKKKIMKISVTGNMPIKLKFILNSKYFLAVKK